MYAIQFKVSGQLVYCCDTQEEAVSFVRTNPNLEVINTNNLLKVSVNYTELGGPHGYGHQEESFSSYGSLNRVTSNLFRWAKETTSTFGPDYREIKDFFKNCKVRLIINNQEEIDLTETFNKEFVNKLNRKILYL
jgi:hypothetical protein